MMQSQILREAMRGVVCWLLGTSVRKVDGFGLELFIFLAARVIHR
jgi:hypothetical protein